MKTKKNIYVVLGMARSGTSVIARGLKALGIDLGNKLTPPSKNWNAKGFWEDSDIVYKINRGALYALDNQWMSLQTIAHDQQVNAIGTDLKNAAVELLKQRMSTTEHWGFKDPRTAKLLGFWQDVFKTVDVNEHYIIALRNPLASARSYQRLSDCDIEEALLLWLMHLISAIEGTHGKNRVVVSYDAIMQDPHWQLNRIKLALNIPELVDHSEIDLYANQFLDKTLQRHENTTDELANHSSVAVAPLCVKVYDVLLQLAKDMLRFEDLTFTTRWQSIMAEYRQLAPIYAYIDTLYKRNKQLERKIRNTKKSILWKIMYPLYAIDNFFRTRRHTMREKRRLVKPC